MTKLVAWLCQMFFTISGVFLKCKHVISFFGMKMVNLPLFFRIVYTINYTDTNNIKYIKCTIIPMSLSMSCHNLMFFNKQML